MRRRRNLSMAPADIDPFFEVERFPVVVNGKEVRNREAIVNPNGETLGIVSKGYKVVTNKDVVDIFGEAFEKVPQQSCVDHLDVEGGSFKRRIIFSKEAFDLSVIPGDSTGIMLEIFNSYNKKSGWGMRLMGYRWACANGMIFGKRNIFLRTFSHMRGVAEQIRSAFDFQVEQVHPILEQWAHWNQVEFTPKHMSVFLEKMEVKEGLAEEIQHAFHQRTAVEQLGWTGWAGYNALTYMATHNLSTRKAASPLFSSSAKKLNRLAEAFYVHMDSLRYRLRRG